MLVLGFIGYLGPGATLGGYKGGCKGPYIDDETAKQLANTGCDTQWKLVGGCSPGEGHWGRVCRG